MGSSPVVYEAKVGWYGGQWIKSLYMGGTSVSCGAYTYAWNPTGGFWRVFVPRSCLGRLINNIKAYTEHVATSPTPGTAGLSPCITRG